MNRRSDGMIIGFDTATADTTVAIMDGFATIEEVAVGPDPGGRPAHGRALLPLIEETIGAAGGWDLIGLIAVGLGPGSFTGLRIGVSTARALAQARALPVVGVPTPAALTAALSERPQAEARSRVGVIDARRGEVFAAVDRGLGAEGPIVCAPDELPAALGGELTDPLAAGDGAVRFRSEIEAAGIEVCADGDPAHRLSGRQICLLGAMIDQGDQRSASELTPMYLRRPDAERWLERNDGN